MKLKKVKKLSIAKICIEIEKHKDTIGKQDIDELIKAIDNARFEWARATAVSYVLGDVESLIHDSSKGGWDRESSDYKILNRVAKHVLKKLPSILKEKVWYWG